MKNLRLRVKEDGNVYVSSPFGVPQTVIDGFVESRAQWIAEQRARLNSTKEQERTGLNDGDVMTLLGRQYVICAVEGQGEPFFQGAMLIVPVSEGENLETAVACFMSKLCRRFCSEAVKIYLDRAGYKGEPVSVEFKLYKSRWGCYNSRDNTITFNLALCKLSGKFIKYVAAHEVTHIFVPNHSEAFYKFGETIYKDFLRTDRELNKIKRFGIFS